MSSAARRKTRKNRRVLILDVAVLMRPLRSSRISSRLAARIGRATYTRSGRVATTALTTRPVITASPMPIRLCHPTIAVSTAATGMSATPPRANSPVKARAAAGTESRAPTAAAIGTEVRRFGNNRRTNTMTSHATPTPTRPISVMLVPSAVRPPSAKRSAWTISTTVITSIARPWTNESGGERSSEEVPAGAGADREVDHLRREDEGRDEAGQRRGALVEFFPSAAQGQADSECGDDSGCH